MAKIDKIRRIIERFTNDPKRAQEDYEKNLAKYARLFELHTMLDELENLETPEENSSDDAQLFEKQISSIGEEVRKVIWQ